MILNKEVIKCNLTFFPYSLLLKGFLLIIDISQTNHKTEKNFKDNYLDMRSISTEFDI